MTQTDPHAGAVQQLQAVAKLLRSRYDDQSAFDAVITGLAEPAVIHQTELSVQMDSGEMQTFLAYRSQHDNAVGPYKGGIRFHQQVTLSEVKALSTWMTWKCSVVGIPYGGGKGGVVVDPRQLSAAELERLSRAYARFIAPHIGPWQDIPAPDVNTDGQIMAWMLDEYQKIMATAGPLTENPLATFTGKPLLLGGSQGRVEATGLGGFHVLQNSIAKLGKKPQETKIAIQGFGNVGYWLAHHAHAAGYIIVAVSDSRGGIYDARGLDPVAILAHKEEGKPLAEYPAERVISNAELLELAVDVVVPAALEHVITTENAARIQAPLILELANGPVTPEADEALFKRGTIVIPDVLANAGGVTVSYFEWVQNIQGYSWPLAQVLERLERTMQEATDAVWDLQTKHNCSLRMAAYMRAVGTVVDARLLRGRQ